MGLKEDAKFARFITMGALGAQRVVEDLEPRGHQVIELERYAMANKIWSTKIKRLRMADLVCVACGRRFEAKAKSKPEVKLSDSKQTGRGWNDGMRDDDIFAFLAITLDRENRPLAIGRPLYFTTQSLRSVPPKQGQPEERGRRLGARCVLARDACKARRHSGSRRRRTNNNRTTGGEGKHTGAQRRHTARKHGTTRYGWNGDRFVGPAYDAARLPRRILGSDPGLAQRR